MHHIETLPLRGVQYHRSLRKIPRGRLVQFRDPIAEQAGPQLGFRCTFVVPGGEQMVEELLYLNGNDIGYFESILDLGDRPAVDVTDLMAFHVKDPAPWILPPEGQPRFGHVYRDDDESSYLLAKYKKSGTNGWICISDSKTRDRLGIVTVQSPGKELLEVGALTLILSIDESGRVLSPASPSRAAM